MDVTHRYVYKIIFGVLLLVEVTFATSSGHIKVYFDSRAGPSLQQLKCDSRVPKVSYKLAPLVLRACSQAIFVLGDQHQLILT